MFALRIASCNYLKAKAFKIAAFRASVGLVLSKSSTECIAGARRLYLLEVDRSVTSKTCDCTIHVPKLFSVGCRSLSSQGDVKSCEVETNELEDVSFELETPESSEASVIFDEDLSDDESSCYFESDFFNFEGSLAETWLTEVFGDWKDDECKKVLKKKYATSALFSMILGHPFPSITPLSAALYEYFDGKELTRSEVYQVMIKLHRRKLFQKALQLSEWLQEREDFTFSERDYAFRTGLIAMVHGLDHAEIYFQFIPKSFRNELAYKTLLMCSVSAANWEKSQQIFSKMEHVLRFPVTTFCCNQMLMLHKKRKDFNQIQNIMYLFEGVHLLKQPEWIVEANREWESDLDEEGWITNVRPPGCKPSLFTYEVLIDLACRRNDIELMEKIECMELVIEKMKDRSIKPIFSVQAYLAQYYIAVGLTEKAEALLKEMEEEDVKNIRLIYPLILRIYSDFNKPEEVERVWKIVESKPLQADLLAAISAWGKLKKIEKSEAVFDKMTQEYSKLSTKQCSVMLKVYAENKMLSKGKELVKRMEDVGCYIGPIIWGTLITLYLDSGEVENADYVLQKATKKDQKLLKPMASSYMNILNEYSKRGDIDNAEFFFQKMREAGNVTDFMPFLTLLESYKIAKVPAHGFRERMQADNVFMNIRVRDKLRKVNMSRSKLSV